MSSLDTMASPTSQVVASLAEQYPLLGLSMVHHRNTRGGPMSFKDKPYLVELYCDSPKIDGFDAKKCVQVGWSELLIQLALLAAGWDGRIVAYVLPSYQLRDRFVQRRIKPLIDNVAAYTGKVHEDDPGTLRNKRFGPGALLWLGSNAVNDFIEFSADMLIVDEYDRCDQANLAFARDRLRASDRPQMFRISNPTIPGRGIDKLYDVSDGRQWHHRCTHCNERQPIDWFKSVVDRDEAGRWVLRDPEGANPVCRRCGKPWVRQAAGGQWVAQRPSADRRGYHLARMDVLSQDLRSLYKEWLEAQGNEDKLIAFYAGVLGLAYSPAGSSVTAQILQRAACGKPQDLAGSPELREQRVVLGADIGSMLNVDIAAVEDDENTMRETRQGVFTGEVQTFDQLYDLLVRYHVRVAVVDAYPETRKAQELRDKCLRTGVCDLWLCEFFPTPKVGAQQFGMIMDWERRVVRVDRTQLLDCTLADMSVVPPRRTWPEDVWQIRHWQGQMEAPKRIVNKKSGTYQWDSNDTPDHYRFSDAYSRVAQALLAMQGTYLAG